MCHSISWSCATLKFLIEEDEYGDPEFIYGFGDNWSHQIIFEAILNADLKERYPVCVSGENASPPEDCGGIHGFEQFKKTTSIIKKRKPKNVLESLDLISNQSGFDPNFFDLISINEIKLGRRLKVNSTKKI